MISQAAHSHTRMQVLRESVHIDLCTEITRQEGKKKEKEKRVRGVVSSAEGRRSISEQKWKRERVEAS